MCGTGLSTEYLLEQGARVTGLDVVGPNGRAPIAADRVVLAGGAFALSKFITRGDAKEHLARGDAAFERYKQATDATQAFAERPACGGRRDDGVEAGDQRTEAGRQAVGGQAD